MPRQTEKQAILTEVEEATNLTLMEFVGTSTRANCPPLTSSQQSNSPTLWDHFDKLEPFPHEWVIKRGLKETKKHADREIRCITPLPGTGEECTFKTKDSILKSSTTNLWVHLAQAHNILKPFNNVEGPDSTTKTKASKQKTLADYGVEKRSPQDKLEASIVRWMVETNQPFTVLETPSFKKLFNEIPGIKLPFSPRMTLKYRIVDEFIRHRGEIKE